MISVLTLITILFISVLITKIATSALIHTGLSKPVARFQARSAFTGTGFGSRETEMIMNHPIRRRIIMTLMLLGNVGVISVLASLILTFIDSSFGSTDWLLELLVLLAGISLLWILASSKVVDHWMSRIINWFLKKYTSLDVKDYAGLLHLTSDYEIAEIHADKHQWISGPPLRELQLRKEGINLIGIERMDGTFIGDPDGETVIKHGDLLIAFGSKEAMQKLLQRKKGKQATKEHEEAIKEHEQIKKNEAGIK